MKCFFWSTVPFSDFQQKEIILQAFYQKFCKYFELSQRQAMIPIDDLTLHMHDKLSLH